MEIALSVVYIVQSNPNSPKWERCFSKTIVEKQLKKLLNNTVVLREVEIPDK